jgi:hypothetical protein
MNADTGLNISSDCTSTREAPPVRNTSTKKAANSQN